MASINTKRAYGEISGQFDGARFEQGGLYFDADGELIVAHPAYDDAQKALAAKLDKAKASDKELDAVLDEAGVPPPTVEKKVPKPKGPTAPTTIEKPVGRPAKPVAPPIDGYEPGEGEIDLKAWGEGRVTANFPAVRALMKKKFSFVPMTKEAAVIFLVDNGIVTE